MRKVKHTRCGSIVEIPEGLATSNKNIYCEECGVYVLAEEWEEVEVE